MNRLASPASNTLPLPSLNPNENYLADDQAAYSVGVGDFDCDNSLFEAPLPASTPAASHSVRGKVSTAAPIASFTPVHYERRYAYPLLVWLHGQAGHETHLHQIMPLVSMRNYAAVAPRGPVGCGNADVCDDTGFSRKQEAFGWSQSMGRIPNAEDRIFQAIDFARQKYNIHTDRIFIAGYGSGGTMAVRMAWKHPNLFAGAASISGPLPKDDRPLRNLNDLRTLPLLLCSGRDAKIHSETMVCRDLRLLHATGLQVALRQYPCGDELRTSMLADLDRWIMDVVCNAGVAVHA